MNEGIAELSTEAQEMLPTAINRVARLYAGDALSTSGGTSIEERDRLWGAEAQQFSPFSSQIMDLRSTLKKATATKRGYPPVALAAVTYELRTIRDEDAKQLLTDIFIANSSNAGLNIDPSRMKEQAKSILSRLSSHKPEGVEKITLDEVIESILLGTLTFS